MQIKNKLLASLLCLGLLTGCGNNADNKPVEEKSPVETSSAEVKEENEEVAETSDVISEVNYDEIAKKAEGTSVNLYGWGGDDKRNQWLDDYIIPKMKEDYDINVNRVGMDIDEILNLMVAEKDSEDGDVDVVWINGENFENAKNNGLLYGPITQILPNFNAYVDGEDEGIKYDFGEPVENMEAPYGGAQFVFLYDSSKIDNPPKNAEELLELAKANPGKITYASLPDFTGSAFIRNIISDIQGYEDFMNKDLTKEELREMLKPTIDYLNELKPYL